MTHPPPAELGISAAAGLLAQYLAASGISLPLIVSAAAGAYLAASMRQQQSRIGAAAAWLAVTIGGAQVGALVSSLLARPLLRLLAGQLSIELDAITDAHAELVGGLSAFAVATLAHVLIYVARGRLLALTPASSPQPSEGSPQ
ncbi:MAG: hypothetical protein RIQ53_4177 [Pseudomonadota bacterium]|jgi:hypothetical protein